MKTMASLSLFVFTVIAITCPAAESDVSKYLAYPNTTLFATVKAEGVHMTIPIAKNFDQAKKRNSIPRFYSMVPTDITDHVSLDYEMYKKTAYGDLYLFVIHREGLKDAAYPVLFTGSPQAIVDDSDVKIELLPNPPLKKSAP